jgi:hypothetical protein
MQTFKTEKACKSILRFKLVSAKENVKITIGNEKGTISIISHELSSFICMEVLIE